MGKSNKKNQDGEKTVRSVEAKQDGKVTIITYTDGSREVQHPGGVVNAAEITGGITFQT